MPVTGLYFIPESPASPNSYATVLDRLLKRHPPTSSNLYRLDHRLLRSTDSPTPQFLQFLDLPHLSPLPFALCGSALITVDRDFAGILKAKLGTLWTQRQTLRAEGHSYEVEDFRVRVGRLLMGELVRGVVVEVEYTGVDVMGGGGEAVMRDFVEGLELPFKGRWVLGTESGEEWGVLDTGRLYCELLRFR